MIVAEDNPQRFGWADKARLGRMPLHPAASVGESRRLGRRIPPPRAA